MNKRILLVVAAVLSLTFVAGACTAQPPSSGSTSTTVPPYNNTPPACPFEGHDLVIHGDSLGVQVGVQLPGALTGTGYRVFNAAEGGSGYVVNARQPIINRVKQWIEQCGNPRMVIIQGGVNDLINNISIEQMEAAVTEISQYLEAKGVDAAFVTIHPLPDKRSNLANKPDGYQYYTPARLAYNQWLMTPGNVTGTVIDCTAVLQDPTNPDYMNPTFWKIIDLFGNSDGLHMSTVGYMVYAQCVADGIMPVLNPSIVQ